MKKDVRNQDEKMRAQTNSNQQSIDGASEQW
jgi:hypothetical protein